MKQTKEEVLANLYSIRAGLSAIGVMSDAVSEEMKEYWNCRYKTLSAARSKLERGWGDYYTNRRNEINKEKGALTEQKYKEDTKFEIEYKKLEREFEIERIYIENRLHDSKKHQKAIDFYEKFHTLLALIPLLGLLLAILPSILLGAANAPTIIFGAILTVVSPFIFWKLSKMYRVQQYLIRRTKEFKVREPQYNEYKRKKEEGEERREDKIEKLEKEEREIEKNYEFVSKEKSKIYAQYNPFELKFQNGTVADEKFTQIQTQTKEQLEQELIAIDEQYRESLLFRERQILKAKSIYGALKTQFDEFLDELDWGNVDFIIYNFQTGRADSMKEALQLVDMERRNEQLIKAVQFASSQIVSSLQSVSTKIQTTMARCFKQLNDNIQASLNDIQNGIDGLQNEIYYQSEKLREADRAVLGSVQNLQQALEEKANVSSSLLAEQIEYLRNHAE